jgi:hypothetical protein
MRGKVRRCRFDDIVLSVLRALLAFAAIVVLLLGASGAQAERFPEILAPPDAPWPEGATFAVFLCREDDAFDVCGDAQVTPAQRRTIEARLRGMPRLTEFRYQSAAETLVEFEKSAPDFAGIMEESDMPESFNGRMLRRSDAAAFDSVARSLPGVSNTVVWPVLFWEDKADIAIALCSANVRSGPGGCEGRGHVTKEERTAIGTLLRRMKGVDRIYYEDPAHAARKDKQFFDMWTQMQDPNDEGRDAEPRSPVDHVESYYVKLDDPTLAEQVINAVRRLPGVAQAFELS